MTLEPAAENTSTAAPPWSTDIEDRLIDLSDFWDYLGYPDRGKSSREASSLIHDLREQVQWYVEHAAIGGTPGQAAALDEHFVELERNPPDPKVQAANRERDALRKALWFVRRMLPYMNSLYGNTEEKISIEESARNFLNDYDAASPERSSSTAAEGGTE